MTESFPPVEDQSQKPAPNISALEHYRSLVASGKLAFNPAQNLVIEALQILSNRLDHYTPPSKVGFLGSLFGKQAEFLKGLYIFGGVGSGKTMLMDLFFETLKIRQKRREHFSAFMENIHQEIKLFRAQDQEDPILAVAEKISTQTVILCLDEFQVTDITDAMILGRLFEALFAHGVILVTTGNIAPKNLYQNGLNRELFLPFIDLLEKYTDIIELETGQDYRRLALSQQTRWHIAPSADKNLSYQKQWQTLSAGFIPRPQTLTIHQRKLTIPLVAGKIARFGFDDLCGKPLGRADYLAIAQNYSTIFIDDIPQMKADNRNEARRFTLLIDSLYDQGCILIASAETAPDQLFTKGKTAAEFQRTASRLIEMSHEDYPMS